MKFLYLGGRSPWCARALEALLATGQDVTSVFWGYGDPKPQKIEDWEGDYILSFKSPLILSQNLLSNVRRHAINFHPSLPCYRGIGGYNYALAEGKAEYGATCHHMSPTIDAGRIIFVDTFAISADETIESLTDKTAEYCLHQFHQVLAHLIAGKKLPLADAEWTGPLFTRQGLTLAIAEE